jgi:small subunit ribosomal protein S16
MSTASFRNSTRHDEWFVSWEAGSVAECRHRLTFWAVEGARFVWAQRQRGDSMAAKIRLKKVGRKGQPSYRIVVLDGRKPRDAKVVEELGFYNPHTDPATCEVDRDLALKWLHDGAKATKAARDILSRLGIMAAWATGAQPGDPLPEAPAAAKSQPEPASGAVEDAEPEAGPEPDAEAEGEPEADDEDDEDAKTGASEA